MGILSGVVSYIFGLCLNLLDAAIDGFLEALGFDLDSFERYFPAAADYHEVIIGFAVGLLFIMFIFQIFRNYGIVLDMEAEDPLKTLGKTALFFGMIMYSRSITNYVIKLLVDPYAIFIGAPSAPYEFKLTTLVTGMFNSAFSNPFMSVIVLIMMLVLGWQFLKLCVEVVERYVVFYFVIYTAPVVFATGAFKSTEQIFRSWCRMLGSQAMLLLLNIWSIKLFLSYMPVFESGGSDLGSIVFNFLMGYAFLKFAQKADTLLRILGLSTASTGDMMHSLGGTVAGIAHAIRGVSGGLSKGLSAAAGLFGKGGDAASAAATATGSAANAGGSAVGGMIGGALSGVGGGSNLGGSDGGVSSKGITSSGISSAKQNFTDKVLNSAKDQLNDTAQHSPDGAIAKENGGGQAEDNIRMGDGNPKFDPSQLDNTAQHGMGESMAGQTAEGRAKDNIRMGDRDPKFDPSQLGKANPRSIDDETMEGLSNLAHGIPHDQYNADTNSFSGGGFQEFTGQDANIIGASQITPADGVEQHQVDLGNGEVGTVYRNSETGEAQMVQFGSVDNGVIQGTISEIDPNTGALGDHMAFKAVHDSVPGASNFSSHSVPVSDSQGGTYHMATGANTSFFAPGAPSSMKQRSDVGSDVSSTSGTDGTMHRGSDRSFSPGTSSPLASAPVSPASAEPSNIGKPHISGDNGGVTIPGPVSQSAIIGDTTASMTDVTGDSGGVTVSGPTAHGSSFVPRESDGSRNGGTGMSSFGGNRQSESPPIDTPLSTGPTKRCASVFQI